MSHITPWRRTRRALAASMVAAFAAGALATAAQAADTVRIGLATKTWFPSVIARAADEQGFFEDEGIEADITVYQSGAEAFTAMVAGAADVISTSSSVTASGQSKGIDTKMFALAGAGNYGWHLLVPPDSDIKSAKDLDGKKVGITSAGSLSDMLARWTMTENGVSFDTIPLGGGGLAPNLISGNVDAVVIYSPLSFKVIEDGDGRSILDYGSAIPSHLNSGWGTMQSVIDNDPELIAKTTRALLKGVAYLQDEKDAAVKMIAEVNSVPESVAQTEWENVFKQLSRTGEATEEQAATAIDLAKLAGVENPPEPSGIWTGEFVSPAQ